jgi:hypothetical protein
MTAYKDLSEEEKQIIIQKNLEYYYKNRQKIKLRTHIYFKEYYIKNHMKMLDRQRQHRNKNYDRLPNPQNIVSENVKIERGKITIDLN